MSRPSPVSPPLLLVDVDGVISLFGFDPSSPPPGRLALVDGIPHFLSSTAATLLSGLKEEFELVWCTGWEERANEHLPLTLGLPAGLRHLTLSAGAASGRHWKLDAIDRHAGAYRSLAWIDDGFDASCHTWAAQRTGKTLLVATDPAVGLTAGHVQRLRRWAAALHQPAAPWRPAPDRKRSTPA